jgi:hypothetical protein
MLKTHEIYSDSVKASNWKVGNILEDCRHGSPTKGCQFEVIDYDKNSITLRQLEDQEYVVANLIFSRIN